MFGQIMVPLDGSDRAERALPCAVQLAAGLGATLHLVRVDDALATLAWGPMPGYLPADFYQIQQDQAHAYLDAAQERLAREGLQVRAELLTGMAATSLLDYERAAGIELLVMCSHGRGGIARFALGSVADRLLRHGGAPVLLVRAFGEPPALERAVVPLDGSAHAEEALKVVGGLAGAVVREVTLLRAIGAAEDEAEAAAYLAAVAQRVQLGQPACRQQLARGDPAQAIIEAAGREALVVMATHGRGGLTRWALGSVADRVARGGVAGVLLVRIGATPSPD